MWNVTPEPMMLGRLPQGYNMETALADEVIYNLSPMQENYGGVSKLFLLSLACVSY
jgi:hypothetical protein